MEPTRIPIFLTQMISHGRDRLHMAPPPPCERTPRPRGIFLGILNIRDGRCYGILQSIRAVHIGGFDLMILMETKITNQYYCRSRLGYNIL